MQELRSQGFSPYSAFAARCGGLLMILAAFAAAKGRFVIMLEHVRGLFSGFGFNAPLPLQNLMDVAHDLSFLLVVFAVCALLGTLLTGLFQTRFMFMFSHVSFSFSRINPFRLEGISWACLGFGMLLGGLILALLLSVISVRVLMPAALGLLDSTSPAILFDRVLADSRALIVLLVPLAGFSGFLAWLMARKLFMRANRMTREEIQQDNSDR